MEKGQCATVSGWMAHGNIMECVKISKFGMNDSIPVPETDIYPFGLVIFQVCQRSRRYRPFFLFYTGPYGRIPIPWNWKGRVGMVCGSRITSGQTRLHQRTLHPSAFLIRCGISSNGAGMMTWNCDRKSRKL